MAIVSYTPTHSPDPISGHVPIELWFDILACPNLRGDLKRVSLTCNTFRVAAQSILCERLAVPPPSATDKHLTQFLTSDHVIGRVKSVTVGSIGAAVAVTPLDLAKQYATYVTVRPPGAFNPGFVASTQAKSLPESAQHDELFHSLSQLRNLTTLSLGEEALGLWEILSLSMIPTLTQLHLEKCVLHVEGGGHVSSPTEPKLRSLTVIECDIGPGALEILISPYILEELTILSLCYMDLNLNVEVFPSLRFLQVPIQWPETTLALLPRCPALQELKLREWGSYGGSLFPGPFPPPRGFRMQTLPKDAVPVLNTYHGRIDDAFGILEHRPITRLNLSSVFDTGAFFSWITPLYRECPQLEEFSFIIGGLDRPTVSHLLATFRNLRTLKVSLRKLTGEDMDQICAGIVDTDISRTVQSLNFLHLAFSKEGEYNGKTEKLMDASVVYPELLAVVKARHPTLRELRLMGMRWGP